MQERLTLALTIATFVAMAGLILFQRTLMERVRSVEAGVDRLEARPGGRPPGVYPPEEARRDPQTDAALKSGDVKEKLDYLVEKVGEISDEQYDGQISIEQDLHRLKVEVNKLVLMVKKIMRGVGVATKLPPKGVEIDAETRRKLKDQAALMGVEVEDGRVIVRGFLNMSPDKKMPIEYFVSRYPEANHETLVHVVGNKTPEQVRENPHATLKGLPTAIYQGLLAAGFEEGFPTHPKPPAEGEPPPKDPEWILATGDVVFLYVRWEQDGEVHLARATDWVLDPATGEPLPHDCMRFTGSIRVEDHNTSEEILLAESAGLLVTVWRNAAALIEVSLGSALRNDFQYNAAHIPKSEDQLMLDLVFSKKPLAPIGAGILKTENK